MAGKTITTKKQCALIDRGGCYCIDATRRAQFDRSFYITGGGFAGCTGFVAGLDESADVI